MTETGVHTWGAALLRCKQGGQCPRRAPRRLPATTAAGDDALCDVTSSREQLVRPFYTRVLIWTPQQQQTFLHGVNLLVCDFGRDKRRNARGLLNSSSFFFSGLMGEDPNRLLGL